MEIYPIAIPASVDRSAARGVLRRDRIGNEGTEEFDQPAADARDESHLPGQFRGIRCGFAVVQCLREHGVHHEKDVDQQGWRIDPIGQRRDIAAAFFRRQPMCLPGIKQIADQDADGSARQNVFEQEIRILSRHSAEDRAEREDKQKLDQVVNKKSKKAIQVTTNKQGVRWGHAGFPLSEVISVDLSSCQESVERESIIGLRLSSCNESAAENHCGSRFPS